MHIPSFACLHANQNLFSRVHVVNIITLADGNKWVCDTGFGGDGMRQPMPLVKHHITQNIGPQEIRFEHAHITNHTNNTNNPRDDQHKAWIYQYRNAADQPWESFFCFTETEFLHQDFEIMNFFTSKSPDSFQTVMPMVVKFLLNVDDEGVREIYGRLTLANGDIKENLRGKTRLLRSCRSEPERLQALEDVFGMTFTTEERAGIKGRVSELLPN